jgi:hypothetical protein
MEAPAPRPSSLRQWGESPLPLAPAALRAVAGDSPVPKFIAEQLGESLELRSLDSRFWDRGVSFEPADLRRLAQWLGGLLSDHREAAVAESGFPPIPLLALCLSRKTHKVFEKALGGDPTISCGKLTIGAVLDLPDVGPRRALEFLAALDVVIDDAYRKPITNAARAAERRRRQRTPREIEAFFRSLAAWAAGERREATIGSSLPGPHPDWPPELVQMWQRIGKCATSDLAGALTRRYPVPRLIGQVFDDCSSRHRLVLRARVLTTDVPTSLDSLARVLDCTEADVRAMQHEAAGYLRRLHGKDFRPILLRAQSVRRQLGTAIPCDDARVTKALDWSVADFSDPEMREFARALLFWLAGPYRVDRDWFVASQDLSARAVQALLRQRDDDGVIGPDAVHQALARLGILAQFRRRWIRHLGEFAEVPAGLIWFEAPAAEALPKISA